MKWFKTRVVTRVVMTREELREAFSNGTKHPLFRAVVAVIQQHREDAIAAMDGADQRRRDLLCERVQELDELHAEMLAQAEGAK